MNNYPPKHFASLFDAQQYVRYKSFFERMYNVSLIIVKDSETLFTVLPEKNAQEKGLSYFFVESADFSSWSVPELEFILNQEKPIEPFREIIGSLMSLDPEITAYFIQMKFPFDLFFRIHLSDRCWGANGDLVSFEQAKKDWYPER